MNCTKNMKLAKFGLKKILQVKWPGFFNRKIVRKCKKKKRETNIKFKKDFSRAREGGMNWETGHVESRELLRTCCRAQRTRLSALW